MPFINFEEVEQLATIDELAEMLGLKTKPYNAAQIRCACPVHGGDEKTLAISPGVRSKRGSPGVFFCQKAKSGGDRIGLVAHCMDIGQQDAAFFIAEQFGTQNSTEESTVNKHSTVSKKRATVPQKPGGRKQPASLSREFDPTAFAAKLAFTDEVAELGISKEDATRLQIGFTRGKVYFPIRNEDGSISGFIGYADGQMKLPPKWLPATSKWSPFPRRVRKKKPRENAGLSFVNHRCGS
jgi:hypothetical protein